MSATSDRNQRPTFIYSNLYELYKKSQRRPQSHVLKTEAAPAAAIPAAGVEARNEDGLKFQVRPFRPVELIGKRIEGTQKANRESADATVRSLRSNLDSLNELHSRLRFMLQELEDLVKD